MSASHTSSVIVGMVVALALGVSMRYIHKSADRFVDRVFFRKHHEDEEALRNFAHEASYITDRTVLLERSIEIVRRHTDADSVAIFMRGDSGSYLQHSTGRAAVPRTIQESSPYVPVESPYTCTIQRLPSCRARSHFR